MKTSLVLIVSSFALLSLGACKKDDPEAGLPPATEVGANTGGCLINGQSFVAASYGGSLLSNPIPALQGGFYEDSLYYLTLSNKTSRGSTNVYLFFRKQVPGNYLFNKNTPTLDRAGLRYTLNYGACFFSDTKELFITDAQHTGHVELTYANVSSGISAGTFEFTAASQVDPTKTITITNGRFDRKQ